MLPFFSSFLDTFCTSSCFYFYKIKGGIFAGLDDLWLEVASGCFSLEMIPCCHKHENKPIIQIMLSGNKADLIGNNEGERDDGMSIRLKVEGFKLAGDKGKRVPKLKLQSVSVTMVLRVSITLEFDASVNKVKINKCHIVSMSDVSDYFYFISIIVFPSVCVIPFLSLPILSYYLSRS